MLIKAKVVRSVHNDSVDRCVDIVLRDDGRYSYREFRRDPEDQGVWYPVGATSSATFGSTEEAVEAVRIAIPWLHS